MYEFLRGELRSAHPPHIVLDVSGVGYRLHAPLCLFAKLPPMGTQLILYTSYIVRETGHQLYGFATTEERNLFEQLTAVSGVGPRLGLSLIGHFSPSSLRQAVQQGDWTAISSTPGIGKKTAERLIVELRGKLQAPEAAASGPAGDAITALINLGYSPQTARHAVHDVLSQKPAHDDVGALIAAALKAKSP